MIVDSDNPDDDPSIIGDEAHVVARTESFTRGNHDALSAAERNQYSNLILLCKTHHKQVDDQPEQYTVEKLREIKATHERVVRAQLNSTEKKRQEDEVIYSGYIDEWQKSADLENWRKLSNHVCSSDTLTLPKDWHKSQREFVTWVIARIWQKRYRALEGALLNYKAVIQDFLNVFDRHTETNRQDSECHYTQRFYRIDEWNPERYYKLVVKFNDHVNLVEDLFFELTRSANYVCDRVREHLFPGYRLREGVLLVDRNLVGFDLKTEYARVEYRGKERTKKPYPGLTKFKKIRYSRDFAISPNFPEPPMDVDDTE